MEYSENREKLVGMVGIITGIGLLAENDLVRDALKQVACELADVLDHSNITDKASYEVATDAVKTWSDAMAQGWKKEDMKHE